ncbi:MAG: hypothetical protein JWR16_3046 [Nevskia sp.]|nr:hypothetical protein [Nevskia sp.]
MIVDTSVWVNALRGSDTPDTNLLRAAQEVGKRIAIVPMIYQEVLQGAKDESGFKRLEQQLSSVPIELVADPIVTARLAASLYLKVRQSGETVRKPQDCLIAASCIHLDLPLLHNDRDFDKIAAVEPLLHIVPVPPP